MKILYFDCFSGISGDMTIGALLDLGIDRQVFLKELSKLNLTGYKIEIYDKTTWGIRCTDVNVILTPGDGDQHSHEHDCNSDQHSHEHDRNYHTHGERRLNEIEQILDNSGLSSRAKTFSKMVYREIASAEAKVHGKSINDVHFHEVGAIDSIICIAGTAICLELLGVEKVYSSALHDGSGFIECAHGLIPVPVPAVVEMLAGSGIPLISEDVSTELVTPTGMGLIKCMAAGFGSCPPMTVEKAGYGHGKHDTGRFNALRVILGDTYELVLSGNDEVSVLENSIEDTACENSGYTMS